MLAGVDILSQVLAAPTIQPDIPATHIQGWAKLVLIALERYSVELKRLTFNFR